MPAKKTDTAVEVVETKAAAKPAAKKPVAKPAAKKIVAKKPAAEKPAAKKPAAEKPAAKKLDSKKTAAKPAVKTTAKPAVKKPAAKAAPGKIVVRKTAAAPAKAVVVKTNIVDVPKSEVSYGATGRRKDAVARVRLIPGTGSVYCNRRDGAEYFGRQQILDFALVPLKAVGLESAYDVIAQMHGGGVSGQAGALRLGISRALLEINPDLRAELKRAGLLKRDPRVVERKKYGLKKARKRPQFSKR